MSTNTQIIPLIGRCPHCGLGTLKIKEAYSMMDDSFFVMYNHEDNGFVQSGRIPCADRNKRQLFRVEPIAGTLHFRYEKSVSRSL